MALILVAEDEADVRISLRQALAALGHKVIEAESAERALKIIESQPVDILLLDLVLRGMDGLAALPRIKALDPALPIIVITGWSDIPTVVQAIRLGALDFLRKPFSNKVLGLYVDKALAERRNAQEMQALRSQVQKLQGVPTPLGRSPAFLTAIEGARKVAPTDLTVVLEGPSGVGKEVFARLIHQLSPRAESPFVALDCATLPESLVESELFGYERGAFTGADKLHPGLLESAFRGTLFLDEINNLPLPFQAKLLRVLQEKRIRRLGGKKDLPIDVRLLAASNLPLLESVRKGLFREDLYHRLNEFTLPLPLLRERRDDIPELALFFLQEANRLLRKEARGFSPAALESLRAHAWPGNVRELKNAVTRAVLLAGETVEPEHLQLEAVDEKHAPPVGLKLRQGVSAVVQETEARLIARALAEARGNKALAARLLSIDRKALYQKLKKYGLT